MNLFYKSLFSIFLFLNTVFIVNAQIYELNENFNSNADAGFTGGSPNIVLMDSNGKYIVAGDFTGYNGTAREGLVRLNADGTLDVGFGDLSATFSGTSITDMEIDASDNIYISGTFAAEVLKIDNTGTIDGGFNFSRTNLSAGGTIQELGLDDQLSKLYIGQEVSGDIEIAQHLSSTGAEDNDFSVRTLTGTSAAVKDIAVDNNNDVYIVGRFNSVGIFSPINIARFDYLTGNFDQNFVPNYAQHIISSRPIAEIEVNSSGDVYTIQNTSSAGVVFVKYQSDGTYVDDNFVSTNGTAPVELTDLIVDDNDDYFFISGEFGVVYGDPATLSKTDFFAANNFESSTTSNVKSILYNETSDEFIAVGDFDIYGGKTANTIAKLGLCETITINTEPEVTNACVGESRDISVDASGTGLTYQWQVNTNSGSGLYTDLSDDATYANTNSNTLIINNITTSLNGNRYRVIISDGNCSKTSQNVVLPVTENPSFTTQPTNVTACQYDDGIQFSAAISGNSGNLRWQVDSLTGSGFVDLPENGNNENVFTSTLTLNNINSLESDGYQFRLVAAGCETEVISNTATLNVNPAPEFSISGNGGTSEVVLCDGGNVSYVANSENQDLTYQWQIYNRNTSSYENLSDGGLYSGTETSTLSVDGANNTMEQINSVGVVDYKCIATNINTNCMGESNARLIIIEKELTRNRITTQPTRQSDCDFTGDGRSLSFQIETDLDFGEYVQWQVDSINGNGFINIPDEKSNSLTFVATQKNNDLQYRAVIMPCAEISDTVQSIIDRRPELTISDDVKSCENEETLFIVESDQPNVTYQWEYRLISNSGGVYTSLTEDGNHLGVNDDTLRVMNNTGSSDILYRCVVSSENDLCESISQSARLTVYSDPNYTTTNSTGDLTVCQDGFGSIQRTLSNYDGINADYFSFQWQVSSDGNTFTDVIDNEFYTGAADRVLKIDSAAIDLDSNYYRLSITGCSSNFYSDTSQLFIEEAPVIETHPEDQTICYDQGEVAVFGVIAKGDNLIYQWLTSASGEEGTFNFYTGGSNSTSDDNDSIFFDGNNYNNIEYSGNYFKSRIINGSNCEQIAESDPVQFIMNEVTISSLRSESQEMGTTVCINDETYVFVEAQGKSLNYQWQIDLGDGFTDLTADDLYSSVNDDTLRFVVTSENIDADYRCVVSGLCDPVTSSAINISSSVVQSENPVIESNRLSNGDLELFVQNIGYNSLIWYDEDGNQLSTQERPLVNSTGIYSVEAILNGCGFMSEPFEVTETVLSVKDAFSTKLYPNPVSNRLKLDLGTIHHGTTTIRVYEVNGTLIKSEETNEQNASIDVSDLRKGVYLLILKSKRGTVKRKFVKE
ncbi:T9SS type A sorting domain-containing protein [Marivirga salinae]|uniref:T9SS type A sorting domain-containing protein n=1 Tax=Marivirga salinarum TaxID=3059078 RepID=A0AA51R8Y4_9BACT|nr:T9SS type A sorting domain-containing protein [Marivirga sp. BDSF4-3]WMN11702.1 T9SS type A sorting domain-containing protein [Marivirga sp. BDSF4-3]